MMQEALVPTIPSIEDAPMVLGEVVVSLARICEQLAAKPAEVGLALAARHVVATRALLDGGLAAGAGLRMLLLPCLKLLIPRLCRAVPAVA